MCSNNQPKTFPGADPLGTGGTFAPATTYASGAQPTSVAAPIKPPAAPVMPAAPVVPGGAPKASKTVGGPANFNPPRLTAGSNPLRTRFGY